jgi:hypothetical protein
VLTAKSLITFLNFAIYMPNGFLTKKDRGVMAQIRIRIDAFLLSNVALETKILSMERKEKD